MKVAAFIIQEIISSSLIRPRFLFLELVSIRHIESIKTLVRAIESPIPPGHLENDWSFRFLRLEVA
jgi:hypothetical protein